MPVEVSTTIERPVGVVWRFWAVEHVRNHARWDPDMELEEISEGPMGLGTRIRRRNVRWGTPVEGEMEVTEWEPEQAVAFVVRDANMEAHGCTSFEALGPDRTVLTVVTDFPGLDESKVAFVTGLMERSVGNVKALVESET